MCSNNRIMRTPYPLSVEQAMLDLGRRIAIARKARGYTQPELAAAAGVGLSTVVGIEGGHPGASIGNVFRLLDVLHLLGQVDSLLDPARDEMVTEAGVTKLMGSTTASSTVRGDLMRGSSR